MYCTSRERTVFLQAEVVSHAEQKVKLELCRVEGVRLDLAFMKFGTTDKVLKMHGTFFKKAPWNLNTVRSSKFHDNLLRIFETDFSPCRCTNFSF